MNNQNKTILSFFRKLFDSISPLTKKNSKSSNSTRPKRACRNFPVVQSTISRLRSKAKHLKKNNCRL